MTRLPPPELAMTHALPNTADTGHQRAQLAVTIEHRRATLLDPDTHRRLAELTLPSGDMSHVLRACANPQSTAWTGTVITATVDGVIVGWALRWRCSTNAFWSLHLFVDPAWRRRGIGSRLVAAARYRLHRTTALRGFAWDAQSTAFWAASQTPASGAH